MAIERYCSEKGCAGADACKHGRKGGRCVFEYVAKEYEPQYRWLGDGPPPARWMAGGTMVYRSFADYCD